MQAEMDEDATDGGRIVDHGENATAPATLTGKNIFEEHPPQQLGPGRVAAPAAALAWLMTCDCVGLFIDPVAVISRSALVPASGSLFLPGWW